jgi:hypothetical protein
MAVDILRPKTHPFADNNGMGENNTLVRKITHCG